LIGGIEIQDNIKEEGKINEVVAVIDWLKVREFTMLINCKGLFKRQVATVVDGEYHDDVVPLFSYWISLFQYAPSSQRYELIHVLFFFSQLSREEVEYFLLVQEVIVFFMFDGVLLALF